MRAAEMHGEIFCGAENAKNMGVFGGGGRKVRRTEIFMRPTSNDSEPIGVGAYAVLLMAGGVR